MALRARAKPGILDLSPCVVVTSLGNTMYCLQDQVNALCCAMLQQIAHYSRGVLCALQFGHLHNLRANIRCWMYWAYKPLFRLIRVHARARQCIGAFIFWVACMSFDPLPCHFVPGLCSIQSLP